LPNKYIKGEKTMSDTSKFEQLLDLLVNEDKEKAEGYLAHKWNLTGSLPDSHPYKYIRP